MPWLTLPANRQQQIVELEGLRLLLPLTESTDSEVQRLAAHALANLSVNGKLALLACPALPCPALPCAALP